MLNASISVCACKHLHLVKVPSCYFLCCHWLFSSSMHQRNTKPGDQLISRSSQRPSSSISSVLSSPKYQDRKGQLKGWKHFFCPPPTTSGVVMLLAAIFLFLFTAYQFLDGVDAAFGGGRQAGFQDTLGYDADFARYKKACPDYIHFAGIPQ